MRILVRRRGSGTALGGFFVRMVRLGIWSKRSILAALIDRILWRSPTPAAKMQEKPKPVYAEPSQARVQALRMVWPIVCRRLEEFPNINATQLFEELYVQFPGRFTRKQYKTLGRRVNLWRQQARARGVVIGSKTYRRLSTTNLVVDVPISLRPLGRDGTVP